MGCKLFLSHSTEDQSIVSSFVEFMFRIGLKEDDILCTSVPATKISLGDDIYEYLNNFISNEELYAIFFLSDNYYCSPVCLNEMGAVWLKKSESINILLPGFDFNDINGVVNKNKMGIKLGSIDSMTKASFNDLFGFLKNKLDIDTSYTNWETARDAFLQSALENSKEFDMSFSRSYCIGDLENDGCKIIKRESGRNILNTKIDFSKTDSKLCSVVVFNGNRNFINYYLNKKTLCFEAYADEGINCIEVELHLKDVDMSYEIYLNEDEKEFKIPLSQFCNSAQYWKSVSEIKFLLHRNKVTKSGMLTIKNLRIE